MSDENLKIWNHANKIDPAHAKEDKNGGYSSFSLNGYWMIQKCTELWGPIGSKWGVDVLEDRFDEGADIWEKNQLSKGNFVSLGKTLTHTIKVKLWYPDSGEKGVTAYGHTPFVYGTKYGVTTDHDAAKKSMTDAMKKAMSFLGIAGSVYLGEYDDPANMEAIKTEFQIEKAEDQDAEIAKNKQEISDYTKSQIDQIKNATIKNEAQGVAKNAIRYLNRKSSIKSIEKICMNSIGFIDSELGNKLNQLDNKK